MCASYTQYQGLITALKTKSKGRAVVARALNPSTGEVEADGSL